MMCNGLYNNTINTSYFSTECNTIALVQFIVNRVRVASMLTASREIGFYFFFFTIQQRQNDNRLNGRIRFVVIVMGRG